MLETSDVAIVVLAGGAATRLPGKLQREIAPGESLLQRVVSNFAASGNARYLCVGEAGNAAVGPGVRVMYDRQPLGGPLAALVSACADVNEAWIFAVAGDAPRITAALLDELVRACRPGDEAVVPIHGDRREPLAALYRRSALRRAGESALAGNQRSMHALLARLNVRTIPMPAQRFLNVNVLTDLHVARAASEMP